MHEPSCIPYAHSAKNPTPPKEVSLTLLTPNSIQSHINEECAWLEQVCLTENVTDAVSITWAVHHATQKRGKPFEVSISSLLPLIRDQAHSIATFKHIMEKIRDTVSFLNPGQSPVLAADQPLYALPKQQSNFSGNGLTTERTNSLSCSEDSI